MIYDFLHTCMSKFCTNGFFVYIGWTERKSKYNFEKMVRQNWIGKPTFRLPSYQYCIKVWSKQVVILSQRELVTLSLSTSCYPLSCVVLDPTLMPSYANSPQLFGDVISQWVTRSTIELSLKGEIDWSSINIGIHPD